MTVEYNMEFMKKYVPAGEVKTLILDANHFFSDWNRALLIWNSKKPPNKSADPSPKDPYEWLKRNMIPTCDRLIFVFSFFTLPSKEIGGCLC